MDLIHWTDEYSVGVKMIDTQHQKIVKIINKLNNLIEKDTISSALNEIFDELADYAKYHFSTEEKYFHEFDYKLTEEHEKMHKYYIEKIEQFKQDNKLDIKNAFVVLDFLEDWWIGHINGADKKYTKCFNEHGLNGVEK